MNDRIRVLIVDDSAFARFAISKQISADPGIEIIDTARDGIEALDKIRHLKPDVVTLDVEMPQMDGLTALRRIMSDYPTPVVMLSSLTGDGTETTLKALELGAVDFFLKPSAVAPAGIRAEVVSDLLSKIKTAARVNVSRLRPAGRPAKPGPGGGKKPTTRRSVLQRRVIVLGCSTGGPRALNEVIPMLPGDLPASMLVVQHMPPGFTRSLAQRLDAISEIDIKEAQEGDTMRPGLALLAPGGYHMTVDANGRVTLNQEPTECGLRPAANVTMESAVRSYGQSVLGVVLTGMGHDGTRGTALIKRAGGEVIVEDESTCVVYGMPRSVVESGNADTVVPLPEIAGEISRRCREKG